METQTKTFQGSFQSGTFINPLKVFNQEVFSDLGTRVSGQESLGDVHITHEISRQKPLRNRSKTDVPHHTAEYYP